MKKMIFICLVILSVCFILKVAQAAETSPNRPLDSRKDSAERRIAKSGLSSNIIPAVIKAMPMLPMELRAKGAKFLVPNDFVPKRVRQE